MPRINLKAECNASQEEIAANVYMSKDYKRVTWGVLRYPICAVVGGGESAKTKLDILRKWEGDIFAVNDTAGYLSDNGIPCYLYAIDATPVVYRKGKLIKGAIFATRVHPNQFIYKSIIVFDMAEEDNQKGIEGGPTAACRAPHLFLRMGYRGVAFFGIDSSFSPEATHVSGTQKIAFDNLVVVKAGDNEYITNAAMLLQAQHMIGIFKKYPQFLVNASDGLIKGMIENPDTWDVVAVAEDLKEKFENKGLKIWNKEYQFNRGVPCQQPQPTL